MGRIRKFCRCIDPPVIASSRHSEEGTSIYCLNIFSNSSSKRNLIFLLSSGNCSGINCLKAHMLLSLSNNFPRINFRIPICCIICIIPSNSSIEQMEYGISSTYDSGKPNSTIFRITSSFKAGSKKSPNKYHSSNVTISGYTFFVLSYLKVGYLLLE